MAAADADREGAQDRQIKTDDKAAASAAQARSTQDDDGQHTLKKKKEVFCCCCRCRCRCYTLIDTFHLSPLLAIALDVAN